MTQVITFEGYTPIPRYDDLPWTAVRIEEGDTAAGPWAQIDELALDPLDGDPSAPQARNFTTALASDTPLLWYRAIFVDAATDAEAPTEPVQNGTPAVAAFATSDDLAARLGLALTDDEETRADVLLNLASGLIQGEAKQTIELVEDDVLTLPGTFADMVKLPEHPVVSIASVTLDGTTLVEGTDWYLKDEAVNRIPRTVTQTPSGLIDEAASYARNRGFGTPRQTLTITYTHGYEDGDVPTFVKAICLEVAVRAWVNPGAAASTRVGDTHDTYDLQGMMLTDAERRTIRRFFGRSARSITVGRG